MSTAARDSSSRPGDNPTRRDPNRTYFFLHVMKTGGTSMLHHIIDNFPLEQVEAGERFQLTEDGIDRRGRPVTYPSMERLRSLGDRRRREIRVYAGHYPFMVTDLILTDVTMTVLRDPVERTISFLRHCKRYDPAKRPLSLEEIYDGPWDFPLLIRNYQAKLFAMRLDDAAPDRAHLADIVVDERRLDAAKTNLATVDLIGLQHRFGEFLGELTRRYGWTFTTNPRRRAATEDWPATPALRQRIVNDNQADVEFFRFAEELCNQRRRTA